MADDTCRSLFRGSFRFLLFLVICAYFVWGCYWLYRSMPFSYGLVVDYPSYMEAMKETWWVLTFYASELGLSVGIVLRWIAGLFALYSGMLFLKGAEKSFSAIKGKIGAALLFEGAYFLTYIPSVILGFIYPFVWEQRLPYGYWLPPPWLIVFLVNSLACLPMVVVLAPLLFKLRSKVVSSSQRQEIIRWSCITGVAYLFVLFWLNYSLAWTASLVYWPERAQPGVEILKDPINLISFLVTVIGLLLISVSCLKFTLPAIRGRPEKLSLKRLGYVMLAFGFYFILILVLYQLKGGYHAQPTVAMELLGPLHNPDLWCAFIILPGLYLAQTLRAKS